MDGESAAGRAAGRAASWLARFDALVTELFDLDLDSLTVDEFVAFWQERERIHNQDAHAESAVVARGRDLSRFGELPGARSLAEAMRVLLRISIRDARARIVRAEELGPQRHLDGSPKPPILEQVAEAHAQGRFGAEAASLLVKSLQRLDRSSLTITEQNTVQAQLVRAAASTHVDQLARTAEAVLASVDADERLHEIDEQDRHRGLSIRQRPDGSSRISGELTAECTELLLSGLDSTARPEPAKDGVLDPRKPAQRRHDGLLELVKYAHRSGQVPDCAGVTTTVVLQVSADDWVNGTGFAVTGHGAVVPTREARRWTGSDTRYLGVVLDSMRKIVAITHFTRYHSEHQRLAMALRDKGCSFPDCDIPASWCQSHHVESWAETGRTSVDQGTLLCGFHHREFQNLGWSCEIKDGTPWWTPPRWIDRERTPIRNTAHDLLPAGSWKGVYLTDEGRHR